VTTREFQARLRRRTRRADVQLCDAEAALLEEYVRLLGRWNAKINLTALSVADPDDEAVDRLIVEPLAAAKVLPAGSLRLIDIGSGTGSPAIPLLVARPDLDVILVESKTRKAVFLTEVVRHLGLPAAVETARYEHLLARPDLHESADVLTIRAVRVESRSLLSLQAFLKPGGQILWFRAAGSSQPSVPLPLRLAGVRPLLEAARSSLVLLEKEAVALR
jgi:16S rRNA (guanine527-N7)-methyltransferase